jgi:hypothetical protein
MEIAALILFYGLVFAGIVAMRRRAWADVARWRSGWSWASVPQCSTRGRTSAAGAAILPLERPGARRSGGAQKKKRAPTRAAASSVVRLRTRGA